MIGEIETVPFELHKAPIVQAIFEVRFEPNTDSAGDLLPGLFYSAFKAEYETVQPLPLASVPKDIREKDSNLRYKPNHAMEGQSRKLQFGQHVVNLIQNRPYEGWSTFESHIGGVLDQLKRTNLVANVERLAIRAINIIPSETASQLSLLDGGFTLSGHSIPETGFHLRTEVHVGKFTNIVQIGCNVHAQTKEGTISGLLIDIDSLRPTTSDEFWGSTSQLLNETHVMVKRLFFSVLKPDTVQMLEPEWEKGR